MSDHKYEIRMSNGDEAECDSLAALLTAAETLYSDSHYRAFPSVVTRHGLHCRFALEAGHGARAGGQAPNARYRPQGGQMKPQASEGLLLTLVLLAVMLTVCTLLGISLEHLISQIHRDFSR